MLFVPDHVMLGGRGASSGEGGSPSVCDTSDTHLYFSPSDCLTLGFYRNDLSLFNGVNSQLNFALFNCEQIKT